MCPLHSRHGITPDMMRPFAASVLASLILVSFTTASFAQKAVTIKALINPETEKPNQFSVMVELDIASGWHIYDDVGEGAEIPTSLKLKLPEGVTAIGDWDRPISMDGNTLGSMVYEGQVSFSKSVAVQPSAYGESIDVTVSYQACTDLRCNRPKNKTVSIVIPKAEPSGSSLFDSPVIVNVKDAPLNTVTKAQFLSPGMFDVDGDEQVELVVGDLFGNVGVYENLNTSGEGDPVWGPRESLKGIDGKAIQTSNW